MASIQQGRPSVRPSRWPDLLIGLGVVAVGLVVLADTWTAPAAAAYAQVGPQVFPYMIGGLVVLLGGLLAASALRRGSWRDPDEEAALAVGSGQGPAWGRLGWVVLGLLANLALIGWLGFVLASTVLFACVARGFASARPGRDLAIGFALALAAYLGFARLLAIRLGDGLLERLL